jgi:hypothetical protein
MFHPYNYTKADLNELIIKETPYDEGTIIEIIETEKFKNYPYTVLSYGFEDPEDSDFVLYRICGVSFDHNFILTTYSNDTIDVNIIPGIINAREIRLKEGEEIIGKMISVKKDSDKPSQYEIFNVSNAQAYPRISLSS